jgi:dihydroxyacetone kinase-like predicted kinase
MKARLSIENPQKGTILDVMDEAAQTMEEMAEAKECSLDDLFMSSFERSKVALEHTKEEMTVLRESQVVDAGGLAFLIFLQTFAESITSKKLDIKEEKELTKLKQNSSSITKNRYEVVFIVKDSLLEQNAIKEMLSELGDSIDIVDISGSVKTHIHTDKPEMVKEIAYSLGEVIFLQIADMKEEKIIEIVDKVK